MRVEDLKEESPWALLRKASILVLALAFLFFMISFSSPYWAHTSHHVKRKEHIGIWKFCVHGFNGHEACTQFIDYKNSDYMEATQGIMTIALFMFFFTFAAFCFYIFVTDYQDDIRALSACIVIGMTTASGIIIGVATFGAKYNDYFRRKDAAYVEEVANLGWAYYMAVVVGLMVFCAPLMLIPDAYYTRREIREVTHHGEFREAAKVFHT